MADETGSDDLEKGPSSSKNGSQKKNESDKSKPSDDSAMLDKVKKTSPKKTNDSMDNSQPSIPQETTDAKAEQASPADLFTAKPMPKMPSKKSKKNWLFPSIITILLLVALLGSSWSVYQQYLFKQNWTALQSNIDSQISQQSQAVEQAKNAGQASLQAANQTQLQLNQMVAINQQLKDSLFSTQERIKALSGRQKQDWMLAEAAYLIKIAQIQLSLQKDRATAIQLLKTADSRIIEIADSSLLPIREAIARDLSDLSLVMESDVTGIALALNAINQQIPNLELTALQFEPIEESIESKETQEDGFDLDKIYQNFLKDFVVIKDHSEPVKPLMTADQRINLNNNIQLAIQQAQIALVQGNGDLYRLNIETAIQWTDEFFIHDEKATLVTEQLNALKTKPVEIHYPNKLQSQKALDEISRQQLYHWLEGSLSSPVPDVNIAPQENSLSKDPSSHSENDPIDESSQPLEPQDPEVKP